jgi:hypothetical protein
LHGRAEQSFRVPAFIALADPAAVSAVTSVVSAKN